METNSLLDRIMKNKEFKKRLEESVYIICIKELQKKKLINDVDYQKLLKNIESFE